jgi:hypothetical protein
MMAMIGKNSRLLKAAQSARLFIVLIGFSSGLVNAATIVSTVSIGQVVDNSASSATFTIANTGIPNVVTSVSLYIHFTKHDGEAYQPPGSTFPTGNAYFNEIRFSLVSPSGTTLPIIAAGSFVNGSSGVEAKITFTDLAALAVNSNTSVLPGAGNFKIASNIGSSFAVFNNSNPFGNWRLNFSDSAGQDGLSVHSSTLTLIITPTPEASSSMVLAIIFSCCYLLNHDRRSLPNSLRHI